MARLDVRVNGRLRFSKRVDDDSFEVGESGGSWVVSKDQAAPVGKAKKPKPPVVAPEPKPPVVVEPGVEPGEVVESGEVVEPGVEPGEVVESGEVVEPGVESGEVVEPGVESGEVVEPELSEGTEAAAVEEGWTANGVEIVDEDAAADEEPAAE